MLCEFYLNSKKGTKYAKKKKKTRKEFLTSTLGKWDTIRKILK